MKPPIVENVKCEKCEGMEDVRDYSETEQGGYIDPSSLDFKNSLLTFVCDDCKNSLDDEFSDGYCSMYPNETPEEFFEHEDFD